MITHKYKRSKDIPFTMNRRGNLVLKPRLVVNGESKQIEFQAGEKFAAGKNYTNHPLKDKLFEAISMGLPDIESIRLVYSSSDKASKQAVKESQNPSLTLLSNEFMREIKSKNSTVRKVRSIITITNEHISDKLTLKDLDDKFLLRFRQAMIDRGCSRSTTVTHFKIWKSLFRWLKEKRDFQMPKIDWDDYIRETNPQQQIVHALTETEVTAMVKAKCAGRVKILQDLFIILVSTGVRWGDLIHFDVSNIDSDGYFSFKIEKTDKPHRIQLSRTVIEILKKYDGRAPKLCNQEANRLIKKLARIANVNRDVQRVSQKMGENIEQLSIPFCKVISIHDARRSFARRVALTKGLSEAQRLIGHSSERLTYRYTGLEYEDKSTVGIWEF